MIAEKPYERSFQIISETFSVMQWNTLASALCSPDSFPKADPNVLKWEYRAGLIKQEIESFRADICCFEEVDQIDYYSGIFKPMGYEIYFEPKAPGRDGTLIAWNSSLFEVVLAKKYPYIDRPSGKQMSQFFSHVKLRLKKSRKELNVFATHLKAKEPFEKERLEQVGQLLELMSSLQQEEKSEFRYIICGDFNAEPSYESTKNVSSIEGIKSVYGEETLFTTFKIRSSESCRVIDYIFYTPKFLTLTRNSLFPSKELIGVNGLPNNRYPSDHLSLFAEFLI